ncbi:flavoprotein [Saccharopolyspora cebuensis]|uniref:flavoprotein n=1 Tax=Saccharopolyspora cebuensis TaxID=418759 RepID=UPI0031F03149
MTTKDPILCDKILVGISGSPACLSMPQYILLMRRSLARRIDVIMTRTATRFLPGYAVELHAGRQVHTDLHEIVDDVRVPHLDLAADADMFLVMPATANVLGKAAAGIGDDLLSTAILGCAAPVVFVPAMNAAMWENPVVQRNVDALREVGHCVVNPGIGVQLADRAEGRGAMPPLEMILDELMGVLKARREPSGLDED